MTSPQPPPTTGGDFFQWVLSVPVGPAIEGLGFPLGFSSVAEGRNPAATNRAVMLDEVVDYVNFLRLQVKVLSMSGLCGAEIPPQPAEEDAGEAEIEQHLWNKWLNDITEGKVPKLVEEDIGATMQFLQYKVMCSMPATLAAAICHSHHQQPRPPLTEIPDPDAPS